MLIALLVVALLVLIFGADRLKAWAGGIAAVLVAAIVLGWLGITPVSSFLNLLFYGALGLMALGGLAYAVLMRKQKDIMADARRFREIKEQNRSTKSLH